MVLKGPHRQLQGASCLSVCTSADVCLRQRIVFVCCGCSYSDVKIPTQTFWQAPQRLLICSTPNPRNLFPYVVEGALPM